ncbi:hypothetical protein FRB94_011042 [Tulasnella sp. JGI-2019a]|nr:hypothetical protein FRB94_011042 [Tulasnella sp. JGI-2019a]
MNQSAQPYLGSLPPNETGVGDEGSSLPAHVLTQETQQPPLSTAGPESLPLNQKGRPGRPGPPTQEERETQQPRSESPPANQEGHGGDKEPIQSADALTEQTQQPPPPSMTGPASLPLDQKGDRPDEGPGRSGYPPTRQERETQQLQSESPSADREGHGGDERPIQPADTLTEQAQQLPHSTAGPESPPLEQKGDGADDGPGRSDPRTQEERETQQHVLPSGQQPSELPPHMPPPAQPRSESPPANQEGHGGDEEPIQPADGLTEQTQQPPPPSTIGLESLSLDQKGGGIDEEPGRPDPPTQEKRETQQHALPSSQQPSELPLHMSPPAQPRSESPTANQEGHGGDEEPFQPAGALMQQEDENEDSWFCTSDLPVGQTSVEGYYLSPPGQPVSKGQLLSQGMSQADPVDTTPLKLDDRRCCSWC